MRSVVIGTAGHIDHGKSALVRALTGTDPDRLKEEKARGITIDLGFAHVEHDGVNLAFVDVPGHERFVKNMLAGAGGIDVVMFVVAADESVMPQTREHFQICRLLDVKAGVIALTKSDLADEDMQELAALEVRELTAGSFLADAPLVRVSSTTGYGLEELEKTLLQLAASVPGRRAEGAVRLPIDRVFSVKGFGTVVTGTLVSGELRDEQELVALPRGIPVKVRGIQVHGRRAPAATAGRRVAVNLGGVDVAQLARGDTLAVSGSLEASRRIDVVLDLVPDARPLRHGARVRFHQGTAEILGRVALAGIRRGDGSAAELAAGASAYARVRLESPVVVTRGDRFIVRAYSPTITIGGGVVLDPDAPRSAIRNTTALARFQRLDPDDSEAHGALLAFIDEKGAAGLPRQALVARAGLTAPAADVAVAELVAARRAVLTGDVLVSPPVLDRLHAQLVSALEAHHRAHPLSDGLPREEARERVFRRAAPAVFEYTVRQLVEHDRIVARDRLALATHQVSLSSEEALAQEVLERAYREAGLTPPELAAAAEAAAVAHDVADRVIKLLVRRHTLVKVDTLLFHAQALEALKTEVRELKRQGTARVDVAAFKARYGVSRKYAIPLLEYLDRERVTRRAGESRVIL